MNNPNPKLSGELPLCTRGDKCPDLWIAINNGWPVGRVERTKRLCLREETCR